MLRKEFALATKSKSMGIYTKVLLVAALCAAFAVGGAVLMSPTKAATSLSDAASLSLDNEFTGVVNQFPSIKIGKQGVGGVTFFNGTIVNATTTSAGAAIPVTFGDDVRIDGSVWRGAESGTDDDKAFKIDDNAEIVGSLTVGDTATFNGNTAFQGDVNVDSGNFLQIETRNSPPATSDCENNSQSGRLVLQLLDSGDINFWACKGSAGWTYLTF